MTAITIFIWLLGFWPLAIVIRLALTGDTSVQDSYQAFLVSEASAKIKVEPYMSFGRRAATVSFADYGIDENQIPAEEVASLVREQSVYKVYAKDNVFLKRSGGGRTEQIKVTVDGIRVFPDDMIEFVFGTGEKQEQLQFIFSRG